MLVKYHDKRHRKNKTQKCKKLLVFLTSFNPYGPKVNKIINRNIHLLHNNDNLKELYPKGAISSMISSCIFNIQSIKFIILLLNFNNIYGVFIF